MLNSDIYGCKPQTGLMKPATISLLLKHAYDVNIYIIFTCAVQRGYNLLAIISNNI